MLEAPKSNLSRVSLFIWRKWDEHPTCIILYSISGSILICWRLPVAGWGAASSVTLCPVKRLINWRSEPRTVMILHNVLTLETKKQRVWMKTSNTRQDLPWWWNCCIWLSVPVDVMEKRCNIFLQNVIYWSDLSCLSSPFLLEDYRWSILT